MCTRYPPRRSPMIPLIRFSCPGCSASIDAPLDAAGRPAECPDCGAEITIPSRRPAPPPPARGTPAPVRTPPAPRYDLPPVEDDGDDVIEARRRQLRARSRLRLTALILFVGLSISVLFGVVVVLAVKSNRRAEVETAKAAPREQEPSPHPVTRSIPRRPRSDPPLPSRPLPPGAVRPGVPEPADRPGVPGRPEPEPEAVAPKPLFPNPQFGQPVPAQPPFLLPAPGAVPPPNPFNGGPNVPKPAKKPDPAPVDPAKDRENKENLARVAKNLRSKDPKVRLKAAEECGSLGEAAALLSKELCDVVLDPNQQVALAAFTALESVRPDLYKPLALLLIDKADYNREVGAEKLGKLGVDGKPAAAILVNVLRQSVSAQYPQVTRVDLQVYAALRKIGADDPDTIKAMKLLAGPANSSTRHRYQAIGFLAQWAGNEEERRTELLPLVKAGFDNADTLIACITLAGAYGELSRELLPTLKKFKLSSDAAIREAATKAVAAIEAK